MIRSHIVTGLVKNETGTLNRLTSLFRRRGFSLASLNAGDCEKPGHSRLTLVVNADDDTLSQCLRQLEKLLDVVQVQDLQPESAFRTELAIVKLSPSPEESQQAVLAAQAASPRPVQTFGALIVATLVDQPESLERSIASLSEFGLVEVVRTGLVALAAEQTVG